MTFPSVILAEDITSSTMEDARSALAAGYGHGTVCTARTQSAGRGRIAGRRWEDGGSGDLLFTLILDKSSYTSLFPPTQALALALCRRLEKGYGLSPLIKWPNDVLISGAKIAGILVETQGDFFLAGIGVNLIRREYPENLRRPAVSVAGALANLGAAAISRSDSRGVHPPSAETELPRLLEEIEEVLRTPPPIGEIANRLNGLGRPVKVRLGDPSRSEFLKGTLLGLAPDGSLQIESEDGEIALVYSGEIESG